MKGWSGIRLKCLHSVCFIAGEMQAVDVLSVWPLHICTWDQHLENARDRVADIRHNNCSLNALRGGLVQFERQ